MAAPEPPSPPPIDPSTVVYYLEEGEDPATFLADLTTALTGLENTQMNFKGTAPGEQFKNGYFKELAGEVVRFWINDPTTGQQIWYTYFYKEVYVAVTPLAP